jgi:hypothetical protein
MAMTKSDDRPVARALQAARRSAGFDTAESAAIHFGWPVARYRAHESGTRNASDDDLIKYAQGFGLPLGRLARPDPRQIERKLSSIREKADDQAKQTAKRLRCARILRGYRSARTAAPAVGVKSPTYTKHENGENRIAPDMVGFYAQMFRVSPSWLQTGELPSGLGARLDEKIRAVVEHPESYVSQVEPEPSLQPAGGPMDLKPGRPQKRTVRIAEYRWSDLELNEADVTATLPHGLTTFPMLSSEEDDGSMIFSVVVDKRDSQLPRHSRVIVWAGGQTKGDYLISDGRKLGVFSLDPSQARRNKHVVLGRVIGRLEPLARE